ncbi:indolepyruvate ferredoxin oxidoreductase subunit alpha [Ihubacter massiliensis]|uniref:Indolepyruvate oxidoreductase subunit IorA n=1 Tax=Hominibacterium faecale TaxID=2839743 RepID=A0A9J6QU31_9FIRM|nr:MULTISPECIES: indolepyruvate ferredoxin oxidoreductase subunit alpha [Eubacteriales Family XIII. Incertae Sedis]MCO7122804.1 indolepyruvate ferredoxin oxidoreductase subunit alpha [Ihubacter massiliensis]MCU7377078.1 indolepyruvate ferredoxin oxidoreductase subunit alpha [Hominibacterium faecale]MDE8731682.1 indolepyruvate ferredoxin oxidoreductase subunit alpha [Eubacteriales bacterium DFI.9.88]MDY3012602.1 indolepyruvate ferredoxin oxidoreductase subunit alpha [Clostridiales Family XIII ba
MEKKIMLGNEAFARGAFEAGVRVISSYPGTPSTEVTEAAAQYDEMHVEWAPNEKVGTEVAVGASIGGARALSCMKHVGLNVAADPFFTAAYTGVTGGLVVLVADDNGCHSSQNEQDSRYHGRGAGVPILEPANAQECKDFMKYAYELSEKYDTPVLMRSNTRISHSRGIVTVEDRKEKELIPYEKNIQKYVAMPAMAKKLHVIQEKRLNQIEEDSKDFPINRIELNDKKIGIITSGICYQYVKEALPQASVLKMGIINPLPKALIEEFAKQVEEVYVIEEGNPFFEEQIRAMGIPAKGKEMFTIQGEYSANMIREAFTGEAPEHVAPQEAPARPPLMCAGCPHRGLFYILGKLKKHVMGDIGCYTLGSLPPTSAMDACLCMGASITMAHGFEKARGKEAARDTVAVLGDSTFFHSGVTGLINMNYNQATGTVIILDNRITGMTGHQDNPSTGKNAKGQEAPAIDIAQLCKACGVEHIVEVDPFDLPAVEKAVKEETAREELSVIITKRPCALIVKQPDIPHLITDKCKNCKMCMGIGCPAIELENGKPVIAAERCVGCGLCKRVCPFDAIEEEVK